MPEEDLMLHPSDAEVHTPEPAPAVPEEHTPEPPESAVIQVAPQPLEENPAVDLGSTATVVAAVKTPASTTDEIVDRWFAGCFPSSVIAQTTEGWNFVSQAKEELKKLLNNTGV